MDKLVRHWRPLVGAGLAVFAITLLTGCASHTDQSSVDQPGRAQNFLEPVGRFAVEADQLWNTVLIVAVIIFVVVEALIVVAIFRFRDRGSDDDRGDQLPRQIHGNPRLEAAWTILPAVILAIVAVPTVRTIFDFAQRPEGALTVNVTGHQWWWEFEYPGYENLVTANELYIPVGETVVLDMRSNDVIHSFWVPKLAGKQDVVPGRVNTLKIQAPEPGTYLGQCAEYCGLSHANMRTRVIVQPRAEFDAWARAHSQPQETADLAGQEARGKAQFVGKGCTGCHTVRGYELSRDDPQDVQAIRDIGASPDEIFGNSDTVTADVGEQGPDLTYFADRGWFAGAIFENDVTGDASRVHDWLADPPELKPMMPQNDIGMPDLGLTEGEIDQLVAFLATLKTSGDEASTSAQGN